MVKPGDRLILLCNDDGVRREEIRILSRVLRPLGRTYIVAPDSERSASSLSLTLRRPLRAQRLSPRIWSLDGTPADCVYFAFQKILPRRPDLLISGMNPGPNLGRQDVLYSGTVAAARQGTFLGVPSMAVSLVPGGAGVYDLKFAAGIVLELAARILARGLGDDVTLNVNIPPPPFRSFRITTLGRKFYNPEVIEKKDPRGGAYYWIGTGTPGHSGNSETDVAVVEAGHVSITPLTDDATAFETRRDPRLRAIARPARARP